MKVLTNALIVIASTFAALPACAVGVGDEIPTLTLVDQNEKLHTLDDSIHRIYINADRKGDRMIKTAMLDLDQTRLDAQKAIVIADISDAPGFVQRLIKSKLRDRHYITWLDLSGNTRSMLPYSPNQVVVLEIEGRRIKSMRLIADTDALKLELAPRTPPTPPTPPTPNESAK